MSEFSELIKKFNRTRDNVRNIFHLWLQNTQRIYAEKLAYFFRAKAAERIRKQCELIRCEAEKCGIIRIDMQIALEFGLKAKIKGFVILLRGDNGLFAYKFIESRFANSA